MIPIKVLQLGKHFHPDTGGIETVTRNISDMLDDFPRGTSVANLRDDLHTLRAIRNDIAHNNAAAAHADSALALKCFVKMLNA